VLVEGFLGLWGEKRDMSKTFICAVKQQQINGSKVSVGIIQHLISEK
jgi:hypothetical protein